MGRFLNALRNLTPRTGRMILEDGTMFNEAEHLARADSAMTSFGEMSVAVPTLQLDIKSVYPLSSLRDKVVATEGDVTQASGEFRVFTNSNGTGDVLFRSVARGRYVAGIDALAGLGVRLPQTPTGDQTIEWGYTDFQNGFVVGMDADGMYTAIYRAGVRGQVHRREDWQDPLETGDFVLNPRQLNVYRLSFRWYGRGPMGLAIAGERLGVGKVYRADATVMETEDGPITNNPNQPLSVRIRNNGTASALECYVAGRQFAVLGDYDPLKRYSSHARFTQSVGTSFVPLVSFRQKAGVLSRVSMKLGGVSMLASEADILWQFRVFSSLTGASWVDPPFLSGGGDTAAEFDISATAISNGIKLYEGLAPGNGGSGPPGPANSFASDLPDLELPEDEQPVTLCARALSGTATVSSVFRVLEEW